MQLNEFNLKECPFCGNDKCKLLFSQDNKNRPRKTYTGKTMRAYRFQVYCPLCHSMGSPVITPYIEQLITTSYIPDFLQDYAKKAVERWNLRLKSDKAISRTSRGDKKRVNPERMTLKNYQYMDKGRLYRMDDMLFIWDGLKLLYGDDGLSVEEFAELEDWQTLFLVNKNRVMIRQD